MITRMSVLFGLIFVCASVCLTHPSQAQAAKALLLFGGEDHKTFLGCLNCGVVNQLSVCNVAGQYGSIVSENSIWNIVGEFGSIVSPESPWNIVASDPPVIVDKDGNSYGYFTENIAHDQTHLAWLIDLLENFGQTDDLNEARERFCGE